MHSLNKLDVVLKGPFFNLHSPSHYRLLGVPLLEFIRADFCRASAYFHCVLSLLFGCDESLFCSVSVTEN